MAYSEEVLLKGFWSENLLRVDSDSNKYSRDEYFVT
jgi:hypothetical protein